MNGCGTLLSLPVMSLVESAPLLRLLGEVSVPQQEAETGEELIAG